jgi:hypothetical protein
LRNIRSALTGRIPANIDYMKMSRMANASRPRGRPSEKPALPIPTNIYYDESAAFGGVPGHFFSAVTGCRMDQYFRRRWLGRVAEFPTKTGKPGDSSDTSNR